MTPEHIELAKDFTQWQPLRKLVAETPFTYAQLCTYLRTKRANPRDPIHCCAQLVGKTLMVHKALLSLYLAGQLH